MKVTILFEDDNYGDKVTSMSTRENVEDLATLALFFTDAVKGAGWDYVVDVGFEKDDGNVVFSGY
jgi:hypothetical protein